MSDKREELAKYAHNAWSGWMAYMFSKGTLNDDGTYTMPKWAVDRWKRQMDTPYDDLPEDEKKSDRAEADTILAIAGKKYSYCKVGDHFTLDAVVDLESGATCCDECFKKAILRL